MNNENSIVNRKNLFPGILSAAEGAQQNSLNISEDVTEALRLSDQENHNKRIESILNNPNLTEKERAEFFDREMFIHRQRIEHGVALAEHDRKSKTNCVIGILKSFSDFLFNATIFAIIFLPEENSPETLS